MRCSLTASRSRRCVRQVPLCMPRHRCSDAPVGGFDLARTCTHTRTHACTRTHARSHTRMHARTHARTHACTRTRTHSLAQEQRLTRPCLIWRTIRKVKCSSASSQVCMRGQERGMGQACPCPYDFAQLMHMRLHDRCHGHKVHRRASVSKEIREQGKRPHSPISRVHMKHNACTHACMRACRQA